MGERVFLLPSDIDPRGRFAVYVGGPDDIDGGLVDIADEDCTSESQRMAVASATATISRVCMTKSQAAWLRDVLIALDLGPAPAPAAEGG